MELMSGAGPHKNVRKYVTPVVKKSYRFLLQIDQSIYFLNEPLTVNFTIAA